MRMLATFFEPIIICSEQIIPHVASNSLLVYGIHIFELGVQLAEKTQKHTVTAINAKTPYPQS